MIGLDSRHPSLHFFFFFSPLLTADAAVGLIILDVVFVCVIEESDVCVMPAGLFVAVEGHSLCLTTAKLTTNSRCLDVPGKHTHHPLTCDGRGRNIEK